MSEPWELQLETVSAICDAWAIDPKHKAPSRSDGALVFVSVAAPAATIKGIRGTLNSATPGLAMLTPLYAPSETDDSPRPRPRRRILLHTMRKARQFQRRLHSLSHQHHYLAIIAESHPVNQPPGDDPESGQQQPDQFYLFTHHEADGPAAFYHHFIRRSPTPTLPEWAEHLWDTAEDYGQITRLDSAGICAWRCELEYPKLEQNLIRALKRGRLPLPE